MSNRDLDLLREDCRRFQVLLESRLVDETELPETEVTFLAEHESICSECGFYASLLDTMENFEADTESVSGHSSVREIVGVSFAGRAARRRRIVYAMAASFIAAIGILFYSYFSGFGRGAQFDLAHGTLSLAGETISQGDHFHLRGDVASPTLQDALIQIPNALFIAVEKHAEIRLLESSSKRLKIALDKGRAAVHLVPNGPVDLTVVLPSGEVDVIGTVFIVDADTVDNQVEVIKGSVAVKYRKGASKQRRLNAGWALSMREDRLKERKSKGRDPLLELLGIEDGANTTEVAEDSSAKDGASEDDAESTSEDREGRNGPKPPIEALLAAARECRLNGDWSCAVSRYRKVISLYPSKPDAATAMISMAQILLDKMNEPADALAYFRRYQRRRPTGGLGREALFGECSALKALGRTIQERECLQKYLEKYPGTLYSKMAKSRLNSIVEN